MQVHSFRDAQFLQWDPEKALKKSHSSSTTKTIAKQVKGMTTVAAEPPLEDVISSENHPKAVEAPQTVVPTDAETVGHVHETDSRIVEVERSLPRIEQWDSYDSSDAEYNEYNDLEVKHGGEEKATSLEASPDAAAESKPQQSVQSTDAHRLRAIEEAINQSNEMTIARLDRLATSVASCFQIIMADSSSCEECGTRRATNQHKERSTETPIHNDSSSERDTRLRSRSVSQAQKGRKRKRQHCDDDLVTNLDDSGTDEEWIVEKILDEQEVRCPGKSRRRKRQYLCQWKSTWVDEDACKDLAALDEYENGTGKSFQ